jgi:repressor of nif and glnA expression
MADIRRQRRVLAILRILRDASRPLGANRLAEELEGYGMQLSARTVRLCLAQMDRAGFTVNLGKRGRQVTDAGVAELRHAAVLDKVDMVAARVDQLSYEMDFAPSRRRGRIILNISSVRAADFAAAIEQMKRVYAANLAMGRYVWIHRGGGRFGEVDVPPDRVAIGTICSVTLNGVLLGAGIGMVSRFGGLLEVRDGKPVRFREVIYYSGTSLDPLEIFIKGQMTRVAEAAATGTGVIGASFREVPAVALPQVRRVCSRLERMGLGGVLRVGRPSQPLLDMPVPQGRAGLIMVAGLNALAAVEEQGIETANVAMGALHEFADLVPIEQVDGGGSDGP